MTRVPGGTDPGAEWVAVTPPPLGGGTAPKPDGLDLIARHALAECNECGEGAWQPSHTARDGAPSFVGRACFLTPDCPGRMIVPTIGRRPRPRRVAVERVPLIDTAVRAAALAALAARAARWGQVYELPAWAEGIDLPGPAHGL